MIAKDGNNDNDDNDMCIDVFMMLCPLSMEVWGTGLLEKKI